MLPICPIVQFSLEGFAFSTFGTNRVVAFGFLLLLASAAGAETSLAQADVHSNINESKYRCPGCAARTCSLPCYKRHQQWAQCTGKRDPTKFVKKSQLVTPAGIDHDFNFLSGIERNLENAERAVSATGVEALTGFKYRGQSGGVNYHRLEAAGVKVIRAPQGLSRQRKNKSHQSSTK